MKYELSDLKNIADELLEDVRVDRSLALRIAEKCAAPRVRKAPQKRWFSYAAASCVACAAAAVLIITASVNQLKAPDIGIADIAGGGISTTQGEGAPAATALSLQTLSAGATQDPNMPMHSLIETIGDAASSEYIIEQNSDGKFGVKKADSADWLIEPEYDSGRIENGIAYMLKGAESFEIPLDEIGGSE